MSENSQSQNSFQRSVSNLPDIYLKPNLQMYETFKPKDKKLNEIDILNTQPQLEEAEEKKKENQDYEYQVPIQYTIVEIQNQQNTEMRQESDLQFQNLKFLSEDQRNEIQDIKTTQRSSRQNEKNESNALFSANEIINNDKQFKDTQKHSKYEKAKLQDVLNLYQSKQGKQLKIEKQDQTQKNTKCCDMKQICENIINITELGTGVQLYFEYIKIIAFLMVLNTLIAFPMFISCLMKGKNNKEIQIGFSRMSSVASYWLDEEPIPE